MKKLIVLSFVCASALVLTAVCSAQEKAAPVKTTAAAAQEIVVSAGDLPQGQIIQGQFPQYQFGQGCPCEFPCYQPCFNGFQRPRLKHACNYGYGCEAPCGQCAPCGGYPYAYPAACGSYGYPNYAPVRNFFQRLFAPRPYCGYDAYYGPYGDFNNGCYAPCNTYGRCW